jgi:predicted DsbA family dithiol-disulfide isomerase
MSDAHVRVTVVSDYLCPWCYVGLARIERLSREFEIDVTWWPYELHPSASGGPADGIDRGGPSPRRRAYYERFRALTDEAGLAFHPSRRTPNSHRALEAAEFAREHGAFDRYHRALFAAFFAEGRDIGEGDVLVQLASDAGLDGAALRRALEGQQYASLVNERTEQARAWGVTGTPTFIFDDGERRFSLVGAQDYAVFENVARRFGARPRAPVLASRF